MWNERKKNNFQFRCWIALVVATIICIIFAEKRVWKIKCLLCSAFHCNSHTEETNFMLRFEELSYNGAEGDAPVVWIPFEKWHFCEKWNENCRCELFSNRFQSTFNLLLRLSGGDKAPWLFLDLKSDVLVQWRFQFRHKI